MTTYSDKHYRNGLLSSIGSSFKVLERSSNDQIDCLNTSGTGYFNFKLASSKGGFKPHIASESELIQRCKDAGLAHYLLPKFQVSEREYAEALDKGEAKMTRSKKIFFNQPRLIRASEQVFKFFFSKLDSKLSTISYLDASNSLNLQASAGYPYYRKKGVVLKELLRDVGIPFSTWRHFPTMRSFRVQLRKKGDSVVPKVRVIYPYPGVITLHEMRFIRPLIDYFKDIDSPYITGKSGGYVSERIISAGKKYLYNTSSDISSFDQSMPNELVYAAFAVIRQAFRLEKKDAELFEQLAAYFVSANLVSRVGTQGSRRIVKVSGIPSGTGFTNILGTIIHAIILTYHNFNWFHENETLLCSDDNLTFSHHRPTFKSIASIYHTWSLTVQQESTDICHGIDKVYFLGFNWLRGVRVIDITLAINQLVYHTDFIVDLSLYDRLVSRAASVLLNGANGTSYFDKLFPDIDSLINSRHFAFLPHYRLPTSRSIITSERVLRTRESLDLHRRVGWKIR